MNRVHKTASKLAIFSLAMFGFGYALVPLYYVFCEITGLNGKTGEITAKVAEATVVDTDREVTVKFDTNVNSALPWRFKPVDKQMQVHPGALTEATFIAVNNSSQAVVGRAVPSVSPVPASLYFNKTECFCFTQQALAPREEKRMVVRFVVDPKLPKRISTLTLSYTFFNAEA